MQGHAEDSIVMLHIAKLLVMHWKIFIGEKVVKYWRSVIGKKWYLYLIVFYWRHVAWVYHGSSFRGMAYFVSHVIEFSWRNLISFTEMTCFKILLEIQHELFAGSLWTNRWKPSPYLQHLPSPGLSLLQGLFNFQLSTMANLNMFKFSDCRISGEPAAVGLPRTD